MKTYTDAQRYLAFRTMALWSENDPEKEEAVADALPKREITIKTEADFDAMTDEVCEAIEKVDPTIFAAEGAAA